MQIKTHNILDFLELVEKYQKDGKAAREYVISSYNHEQIKQLAFPNYSELEKFCNEMGVLNITDKFLELTNLGEKILGTLYKEKIKEIFVLECFLKGKLSKDVLQAVNNFHVNDDKTMWCYKKELYGLFTEPKILPILRDTNFLKKDPNGEKVTINQKFLSALNIELKKIVSKKPPKSQAELEKELEEERENKKKIGAGAEIIVLEFEKNQSRKAKRISQEDAEAGYDIESQDEDGNVRWIEVKGSTGDEFNIYWTKNEIKTARKNRDKYWLYFVPGVDIKSKKFKEPELYPDPIASILESKQYKEKKETLHLIKNNSEEN